MTTNGNGKPYVLTNSGKKFHLLCPSVDEIDIKDIAHSLARQCRFNGHLNWLSVARHSINVAQKVPAEFAMWGLLHDAAEAYLGDMPSPVKKLCPEFSALEDIAMYAISKKFGLTATQPSSVNVVDAEECAREMHEIKGPLHCNVTEQINIDEAEFLKLFYELGGRQ